MRVLAVYGKGGIGKSTVVSNLSILFSQAGKRVLQFGCDPKADSCYTMVPGDIRTVMDEWVIQGESDLNLKHFLMEGAHGVDCIEVGGPAAGTGCGGRGITKAFELVGRPEELKERYDIIIFDVLGDVVCGGFSAPMRSGYAEEVYLVTSGELRALFAANNIAQAVKRYGETGVRLGGIIANMRDVPNEKERIEKLSNSLRTRVLQYIPKDPAVSEAEHMRKPLMDFAPDSPAAKAFENLQNVISNLSVDDMVIPRPLVRKKFDALFLSHTLEE